MNVRVGLNNTAVARKGHVMQAKTAWMVAMVMVGLLLRTGGEPLYAASYQMPYGKQCVNVAQRFNNPSSEGWYNDDTDTWMYRHTGTDCGFNREQGIKLYPIGDGVITKKLENYPGYGDVIEYRLNDSNWCVLQAHQNYGYTDTAGTYRVNRYPEWYNFKQWETISKTDIIGVFELCSSSMLKY